MKPEGSYELRARTENEEWVSGFHSGPQRIGLNKPGYRAAINLFPRTHESLLKRDAFI